MNKALPFRLKPSRDLGENVLRVLPQIVRDYFAAGRSAAREDSPPESLHQFRLATKRFRYTLELFRGAYGPALAKRIEVLRQVQTILGDLNDCAVTARRLELPAALDAACATVRESILKRGEEHHRSFLDFWNANFARPGAEVQWLAYLSRPRISA